VSTILASNTVLSPTDVSRRERVFERDGVLRWADGTIIGHGTVGTNMAVLLSKLGAAARHGRTGSRALHAIKLSDLVRVYAGEAYLLWFSRAQSEATIVLKQGSTPLDQLRAWTQGIILAHRLSRSGKEAKSQPDDDHDAGRPEGLLDDLRWSMEEAKKLLDTYEERLKGAGWDLGIAALETRAGVRVEISDEKA
jgi:hypothetical protein